MGNERNKLLFFYLFLFLLVLFLNLKDINANNLNGSRRVEINYQINFKKIPLSGTNIRVWIPYPPTNFFQKVNSAKVRDNIAYKILEEKEYGNKFIYFEIKPKLAKSSISIKFDITRFIQDIWQQDPPAELGISNSLLRRFLIPDELVPVSGKIAKEAYAVAGKASSPMEKARLLYDHLVKSLKYDKSGKGWGRGDAVYMCNFRKGNCTDFHSLFIGEARSLGIPARFIMGIPIPEKEKKGQIAGYHCWAEFYVKEKGWIPVDISEASKFPEKREFYFGRLDANRIQFSLGRDIKIPLSAKKVNFIIYPYAEINGKEFNDFNIAINYNQTGENYTNN